MAAVPGEQHGWPGHRGRQRRQCLAALLPLCCDGTEPEQAAGALPRPGQEGLEVEVALWRDRLLGVAWSLRQRSLLTAVVQSRLFYRVSRTLPVLWLPFF